MEDKIREGDWVKKNDVVESCDVMKRCGVMGGGVEKLSSTIFWS